MERAGRARRPGRWGMAAALLLASGCQVTEAPAGPGGDDGAPPFSSPTPSDTAASAAAAPWKGAVLRVEDFRDADFSARGWYDGPRGRLEAGGPPRAGAGARHFVCAFAQGGSGCTDGTPGRLAFPAAEAVYLSYQVRYDDGWVGSGRPYHPHEFHLLTTADDRFVGPARTHLTVYIEQNAGRPMVGLSDNLNVNPGCVLRNDDQLVGCAGGPLADFPFGENRSVAACNGLAGDVDGRDCYPSGPGSWYSSRSWHAEQAVLALPGPAGSEGWRQVEAVVVLNSVADGVGQVDGRIRLWVGGVEVVSSDRVLFRTGRHPELRFEHLLLAPYIGDGAPVAQQMRIASLVVARAQLP
jgi:hypothetical protein